MRWRRSTLDIEPLPAVPDRACARQGDTLLFEATGSNRIITLTASRGDADAAFAGAAYVRRERFSVQRFTAVPMEPRGLLADWDEQEPAAHRPWRRQGAVPQPADARPADGAAGASRSA